MCRSRFLRQHRLRTHPLASVARSSRASGVPIRCSSFFCLLGQPQKVRVINLEITASSPLASVTVMVSVKLWLA